MKTMFRKESPDDAGLTWMIEALQAGELSSHVGRVLERKVRKSEGVFLVPSLDSPSWTRVRGRLIRVSDQPDQRVDQRDMDSQTDATPLPVVAPIHASKDAHAHMDRLEQRMRQMRVSDGAVSWDDFDGAPIASLPTQFRMPEIERTWDDLAQEFLRQFAFNTVIDVSRRELEALRQGPEESVTSFISRWREKIA
ncbi:hypothetical protein VitviT2T_026574 [Vitis vinifera]|uniref:Retrotransposon gag domain-containing protein n=1 Tax=Vitis vinifera TaxID=29760 RepID=A0ABY9DML2_VITVI|nr:hypothetical protein VitviT2T_026574 [Vitis vinifera]